MEPALVSDSIAAAILPPRVCPQCAGGSGLPYFIRECQGASPCLRFGGPDEPPGIDEDATARIDPALKTAMAGGTLGWLAAAEPAELVRTDATRLVGYLPASGWIELAARVDGTTLTAFDTVQGFADSEPTEQGAQLLLSGNQHMVFALGGLDNGNPLDSIRRFDLSTGKVTAVALNGSLLETVRGAALHGSGHSAAVLHQLDSGEQRIEHVDLRDGTVTTAVTDLYIDDYDQHSLTSLADGGYVLMAWSSTTADYRILIFDLDPNNGPQERSLVVGDADVFGGLHGATGGVSFLVDDTQAGFVPTSHRLDEFAAASSGDLDDMF